MPQGKKLVFEDIEHIILNYLCARKLQYLLNNSL